jgi:hypothetical protein
VLIVSQLPGGIGIWVPGEVLGVLVEYILWGNSARPVGIGKALDIGAVLAVALIYSMGASIPVTGNFRSWGELDSWGGVPE